MGGGGSKEERWEAMNKILEEYGWPRLNGMGGKA